RVVAADDLRPGAPPVGELLGQLAPDVGAEVVHDRLLPGEPQRVELHRARQQREPEDEMEDVRLREEARKRPELCELPARETSRAVERDVRLRVELVALEEDAPCRAGAGAEPLRDRPRNARRVDGAEGDAKRAVVPAP